MSARVLVVDDLPLNVKVLEAKLVSEYFEVLTASDGPSALDLVARESPDIVLLDVMMPGMDGYEVCQRMKSRPQTAHIPVVMVTALDEIGDRVRGLEAGADDFLTKPVNDVALFARVKTLVRVKMMLDELRLREETGDALGAIAPGAGGEVEVSGGRILVVANSDHRTRSICQSLESEHRVTAESGSEEALALARDGAPELVIVCLDIHGYDGLRFCSQLRTMDETRHVPILMVVDEGAIGDLVKGLDLGVSDYLIDPIDGNELLARTRTQIRQKRYHDRLRRGVRESLTLAVTDSLTGLHNRRYFDNHLETLLRRSAAGGKPLSLFMLDIDFFKKVNDDHGHAAGDEVLREFSSRIERNVRGVDLTARYGGEEFIVALPDTDFETARHIAERLRAGVADEPFEVSASNQGLSVTASIGLTVGEGADDTASAMIKRADEGLYAAKEAGRNRVMCVGG